MAVTRTLLDLAQAVMDELGATLSGETVAASDYDFIISRYTTKLEKLVDEGLAYWPLASIPGVVFDDLTKIVASQVAPSFGIPYDKADAGHYGLRRHISRRKSAEPTEILSF